MTPSQSQADQLFRQGWALHRLGRIDEAEKLYDQALAQSPNHFEALHMSGVAALQTQRFEHGARLLERAVAADPTHAAAHHNRGVALENLGQLEAAVASYDRALAIDPAYGEAYFNRGNALGDLKRFDLAVASYDRAIALDPDYGDAHYNRANALKAMDCLAEALDGYDRVIALTPDFLDAHFNRAQVLKGLNRPGDAILGYDRAIAVDPACADAHFNRANLLTDLGRRGEAVTSYNHAIRLKPDNARALNNLGVALSGLSRVEALKSYDRAIALDPDYAEAFNNRANVLRELSRFEEAVRDYDAAIRLKPDYAEAHENKGLVLAELGCLEAAVAAIERSIAIAPTRVRSYYSLTEIARLAPGDRHLAAMRAMGADMSSLTGLDRTHLHFALGKALADVGEIEPSFHHWQAGNGLKRATISYDEPAVLAGLDRMRSAFTPAAMGERSGGGDPSAAPVFIVGMPRCGSTLIEQILASHPQVFGAGETVDFVQALATFGDGPAAPLHAPEAAAGLTPDQLKPLGENYMGRITTTAPDAQRIVNKTLDNFRFLGLIHRALPNARIIHVRRDPFDTALSCYSKLFNGPLPYAYDLGELGRYYRAYERLMDHWRAVIPASVLLELEYEALIDDPEGQTRLALNHCGLAWHPACLDFHRHERAVRTASLAQVRQPIFKTAIGRWRPYAPFLQPLFDGLGYGPAA